MAETVETPDLQSKFGPAQPRARPYFQTKTHLDQWFSTSLRIQTFNSIPHAVVTHNHKVIFTDAS